MPEEKLAARTQHGTDEIIEVGDDSTAELQPTLEDKYKDQMRQIMPQKMNYLSRLCWL